MKTTPAPRSTRQRAKLAAGTLLTDPHEIEAIAWAAADGAVKRSGAHADSPEGMALQLAVHDTVLADLRAIQKDTP